MKEDLIADIWTLVIEHIPEKSRKDTAADFVNTLIDHGVKDVVLSGLIGVDPYLDQAIEYATDGDDYSEEDDYTGYEDEEE
jgi:hypothetical protein